jgi:hypothetical protein
MDIKKECQKLLHMNYILNLVLKCDKRMSEYRENIEGEIGQNSSIAKFKYVRKYNTTNETRRNLMKKYYLLKNE